ncbi:PaaI family thioesterase [Sulfitobacter porphyrae]|uniref:PaaI family thioesterase n=1 Tax=Sulfitobacter porphyrae TaxID=1246864 RepID=A0ABW2B8A5_9RHOB
MGQTARTVSDAPRGATISLTHQFLAPVRIGDLVTMTPRVTKMTSRIVFLDGSVCVGDDPVVTAQGVWRITHTT